VSSTGSDRLTKNEKREAARESARLAREEQRKKERRTKLLLQGSILVAVIAVVAVVALVIINSVRPPSPGPLNMASDGIHLSAGMVATPTPGLEPGATPIVHEAEEGVLDIRVYVDYLCPFCNLFEETNGAYLESLVENGAATLEIHPISILDRLSQGTKYPTRAANAAACVANYSPNQFWGIHGLLFENQPAENSTGLDNATLVDLVKQAGVGDTAEVEQCINDQQFKGWVADATTRALNGPLPGIEGTAKVEGTPATFVNGQPYTGPLDDLESFKAFVVQAAGADFVQNSTPSPSPSPGG
jgi:protein-disulfide isomerase